MSCLDPSVCNHATGGRCVEPSRCPVAKLAWNIIGPDPILGAPWVLSYRAGTDGTHWYDRRVSLCKKIGANE